MNAIDRLIAQRHLAEIDGRWTLLASLPDIAIGAPETLWRLVEQQAERLTEDERAMLAVGSVAGAEFSAAVASAGGIVPHARRAAPSRSGPDPGVSCIVYAALRLQVLGYPDRVAQRMREALGLARSIAHPFSVAYACHFAAGFHLVRRERDLVQALEDEALAHSTEHGFRLFPMMGAIHRGCSLAHQGRGDEGLAQMREALAATREIGIELRRPAFLALVAEVCGVLGRPENGRAAVADALADAERTGQRHWDAELVRLEGELASNARRADTEVGPSGEKGDVTAEAEACFLEAIEIARRQRARSFELRAATSLSRLWVDPKKVREPRALLSETYAWFTEGLDTPDLRAARALLEEIGGRSTQSRVSQTRSRRAAPQAGR